VSRDLLNEDTNCTEYSALTKPAMQHAYPIWGELTRCGAGGDREGKLLLVDEFTTIEKRLNFHLQRAGENQQRFMAADETFPVKSASPQLGQKPFYS